MTSQERQNRSEQITAELTKIARHKVVDLVGEREGQLLEELDRLEHEEGVKQFQESDAAGAKLCMFCGGDDALGPMTKEHFVPKGLWGGPRPQHTKTVWAHKSCNESAAADNEYFRDVLVMEEGATHPEIQRLREGKIARKFEHSFGSIEKILRQAAMRPVFTKSGIYLGEHPSFVVDTERMHRVVKNVVTGIFAHVKKRPISPRAVIRISNQEYLNDAMIQEVIDHMVPWQGFGDDVFACRYVFSPSYHDGIAALMIFYGRRAFFGMSMPPTE